MKDISKQVTTVFEQIRRIDENGNEYWSARDLSKVLEYSEYRHFLPVVERAKGACQNSGHQISDHFEDILEMVSLGSGAERQVDSMKLSRYACYLIVQNGDPSKEVIALGQTYFVVQTRLQEIRQIEEYNALTSEDEKRLFLRNELRRHNSQLADAAHNAGVIDAIDYAIFQNFGYRGLYGGLDAKAIHQRKRLKKSQNILDRMGSTELAANLFRATQTEEKLRRENIRGKQKANQTHYEVGKKVCKTIQELGGTMPESLPTAESVNKLERKETKSPKGKLPKIQTITPATHKIIKSKENGNLQNLRFQTPAARGRKIPRLHPCVLAAQIRLRRHGVLRHDTPDFPKQTERHI